MKKYIYLTLTILITWCSSCQKLEVPPENIIQDKDVFSTEDGMIAYLARMYSRMPIEDFKYSPVINFNSFVIGSAAGRTGEALSRDMNPGIETFNYWVDAYSVIRECNYLIESLPTYASNFTATKVNNWLGEARFVRAVTYFALAKRYGGVPIVDKLLTKPGQSITELTASIEELKIPRSSEEAVYDFIASDLDFAYANLPDNVSFSSGRPTRYAAAAFKSRAMLFAGSVAKYNTINKTVGSVRVAGIPSAKANTYFKASYDAAVLLNGKYNLYKEQWLAGDKNAQYLNFVNLFLDAGPSATNSEVIFVRQYKYPDAVHGWDALNVPEQLEGPGGNYSSETNPTLNFVEMFDGLPRNSDGGLEVIDANGKYILFDKTMDLFANAEPRLRATVIFPGDVFKSEIIEIRRGIYTGPVAGGINRLLPANSTANYPATNLVTSSTSTQTPFNLPGGGQMMPAGKSGIFNNMGAGSSGGTISGFSLRKYLVPDKPVAETTTDRSEQSWIELRYAEVLLNRAEAAFELYLAGQGGNYQADALTQINLLQERAGATIIPALTSIQQIRKERRKELAFENKIYWDLRRWRIIDQEQNNTAYTVLNPFYSSLAGKYFFDPRLDERNTRYTFDSRWYYQQIPQAAINKSPNIEQNPGY